MKKQVVAILCILVFGAMPLMAYTGLSVSTDFPSIYTSETGMITFDLKVRNYGLSPQRVNLSVTSVPNGWEHVFVGGGGVVEAVFAETDQAANVQLWVDPPEDLSAGAYSIVVRAQGSEDTFSLPLTVKTGENLPQKLSLDPELPSVRGTPDSDFTYNVSLQNNSASEVLVNLDAQAPQGFQVTFKQGYGNKEISTLPVDAGASKEVKVNVDPPQGVSQGTYKVEVAAKSSGTSASTVLTMDIEGQPELALAGPGGRLSGSAVAGREKTFTLTLENSGTAEAKNISMNSSSPRNWNVEFSPQKIDSLPAGKTEEVKATVTPSSEAITGDYNVTFGARSDMGNTSEKFRITVRTSSLWGIVAILIIAAAAVVLVFAVRRFGRR
ncbi:MAG: NEW3 domain-containing protein [Spirochaetia bacterium]|nr:NEW3 domain-containing protein [Spirochaetia bacterium]